MAMTKGYRTSSHGVFRIEIHIVWITKYRYKVPRDDVAMRTRDLIRRICTEENAEVLSGVVSSDYFHILASLDPSTSVSKLLRQPKGKTSGLLQREFPHLRQRYWGQHPWAGGYFAVSAGNVSSEMIEEYIAHHFEHEEQQNDTFTIAP